MKTSSAFRRCRFLFIGAVVLYVVLFLAARCTHVLVHRVSYAMEPSGRVYFHEVTAGNFGPGMLQSGVARVAAPWVNLVFTPLCWAESFMWRVVPANYNIP